MALEHSSLTGAIIGAAVAVHKALGPGFVESVYHRAMEIELKRRGLGFESEVLVSVVYEGVEVGRHKLDLFVHGEIVVELKSVRDVVDVHFAVMRSYLKAVRRKHGLILNFAKLTLESRRVLAR